MTTSANLLEAHLEHDMELLRARLRKEAELVVRALEDAVAALAQRNRKLAYAVILADNRVDVLEGHIDRLCQEFLVRHMPVAAQLRFVVATAKVNSELERIGDYAEAIARRAVTLSSVKEAPVLDRLLQMADLAFKLLRQAIDAFLRGDADLAVRTLEMDGPVNAMTRSIFWDLAHPDTGERDLTTRFVLLGVLNRIERVADRGCNIAEEANYVVRGQVLRHLPRHDLRVLFLCDRNDARSQMAEVVARAHAPAHFSFSSAGSRPGVLDPNAMRFLAAWGHDVSRQRTKDLATVGSLDDYHVVVTLSQEAEEALPQLPYKAVALNWEIADPSKVSGTDAEIEAAYRAVYDELETKIGELVESLGGAHPDREEDE